MRISRTEYPVWNLWMARPFEVDGYAFSPRGEDYNDAIRFLLERPDEQLTVTATREAPATEPEPPARLWDSGVRIDDIMVLLSLAQGRNVHYREARRQVLEEEKVVSEDVSSNYFLRSPCNGDRPITPFELYWFFEQAKDKMAQPGWPAESGFVPAVFWYLDSLAQQVVELRFVCAWHGLQAIASRNSGGGLSKHADAITMLMSYRDSSEGLGFLTDILIEFWAEMAQDYLTRLPEERYFTQRHCYIYTRKLQLSLELALLESLGAGGFARRESVLRAIRR